MTPNPSLLVRTKHYSLLIIRLYSDLPGGVVAQCLGKQLLRSGTSVGAQLRESRRSRSRAEMISKTESALQELEESVYWIELLQESGHLQDSSIEPLLEESNQLIAILVSGVRTLKSRKSAGS